MIHTFDALFGSISLRDIVFFEELPSLLGVSRVYVRQLVKPPRGVAYDRFRSLKFPEPFFVSRSGVRVWRVRDVERWVLGIRAKRRSGGVTLGLGLLDPMVRDRLLGS
jgi:hypothetical protein